MQRPRKRPRSPVPSLFSRETATISARSFRSSVYSALVPSSTFINVAGIPNVLFRRFTPCGKFLVCLSRNHRDLVLFRLESGGRRANVSADVDFSPSAYLPTSQPNRKESLSHSLSSNPFEASTGLLQQIVVPTTQPAPAPQASISHRKHTCHFSRFFTKLYSNAIATGSETLLHDFCLATPKSTHLILASCLERDSDAEQPASPRPAVTECPILDRFTLHLVEVSTGNVCDRFCLTDDYVSIEGHSGVHMLGDMLLVLSSRQQTLHIIKVQETIGRFAQEATIGANCAPDDELEIARAREAELVYRRKTGSAPQAQSEEAEGDGGSGLGNGKLKNAFYTGLMQRLLAYLYRRLCSEGKQSLFYRVMEQYSMLIMQRAQFLDEDHVLIRLGSYERGAKQDSNSTCFFVIYCISSTKIINLFENRSMELLRIYQKFRDMFIGDDAVSATLPPSRPLGNDDYRETNGRASNHGNSGVMGDIASHSRGRGRRIRAALSVLPVRAQCHNVSPYLDRQLFSYTVDRLAALDGSRAVCMRDANSVKFTSVETGAMRFKLCAGMPFGMGEDPENLRVTGIRKKMLFLFHPVLPFVMSMEYGGNSGGIVDASVAPSAVNFHVHGHYDELFG